MQLSWYNLGMSERNLKEVIISILEESHLLSAGAMLEKLVSQGKSYNKTSVYRALEQLEAENTICRHHFSETEAVFELSDHEHIHLVCTNCGKVTSSEKHFPQVKNLEGFSVKHQHVTLLGKCQNCTLG